MKFRSPLTSILNVLINNDRELQYTSLCDRKNLLLMMVFVLIKDCSSSAFEQKSLSVTLCSVL